MKNGWTGGQWSLVRAALGLYLAVHFAQLLPYGPEVFSNEGVLSDGRQSPLLHLFPNVLALADGPLVVQGSLALGCVAALLFAAGWRDRVLAILLWILWASLLGRNPLIANPSLPYVGLLLLVHAGLPRAPYGSWEARGRADPGNGWNFPPALFLVLWILLAVGYSYSGFTKLVSPSWTDGSAVARVLANPLVRPDGLRTVLLALPQEILRLLTFGALVFELGFVAFALVRRLRPWAWGAMLAMHVGLILLIDFADLSLGMILIHLATFDPRWIPARVAPEPEVAFYDGECGLCHRMVRLLLAEDTAAAFRVAPLQCGAFERAVPAPLRADLPDSIVVRRHDGTLLVRSAAALHILRGLGGFWGLAGWLGQWIPTRLRDLAYDGIARVRKRVFAAPKSACPLVPPHLGLRFLPLD